MPSHTIAPRERWASAYNATRQLLDRTPAGRGTDFSTWPRERDEYPDA